MRPIDADEAANLFLRMADNYRRIGLVETANDYEALARIVRNPECLPTIDAVVVVRCKDCKYWSGRNDKPGEVTAIGYCDHPNHHIMPLRAGWYCADGTKMDAKEDDNV